MRMNRRNVLVGLGTIVAGGGAALGTGAFTTVDATREVSVSIAGDTSGALGLSDQDGDGNEYTEASSVSDGTLQFSFDSLGSSKGINLNAETTFSPLFRATNNGSNPINLSIYSDDAETAVQSSPSLLTDYDNVIQNSLSDGNNSVTIEYAFTDGDGSSLVGDSSGGSYISIDTGAEQEITLVIGVGNPPSNFTTDDIASDQYISSVTLYADSS